MRCANCESENPEGTKFCGECDEPFAQQSSVQSLEPTVQKASDFGPRTADARLQTLDSRLSDPRLSDGERKIITALFADMAGFTALTRDLDPEKARALIDPELKLMMAAVHRYEGYVAQSLGDGIFAL
jgi:class 3 adenylate cyclase